MWMFSFKSATNNPCPPLSFQFFSWLPISLSVSEMTTITILASRFRLVFKHSGGKPQITWRFCVLFFQNILSSAFQSWRTRSRWTAISSRLSSVSLGRRVRSSRRWLCSLTRMRPVFRNLLSNAVQSPSIEGILPHLFPRWRCFLSWHLTNSPVWIVRSICCLNIVFKIWKLGVTVSRNNSSLCTRPAKSEAGRNPTNSFCTNSRTFSWSGWLVPNKIWSNECRQSVGT